MEPRHIKCGHRKDGRVLQKDYYGTYVVGVFLLLDYPYLHVCTVMKETFEMQFLPKVVQGSSKNCGK